MTTYDVYVDEWFYSENYEATQNFGVTESNYGAEHDETIKGITVSEEFMAWGGKPSDTSAPDDDPPGTNPPSTSGAVRHAHLKRPGQKAPSHRHPEGQSY